MNYIIAAVCGIMIGIALISLMICFNDAYRNPPKNTGFKMMQYNVEPACINHVQYYAVGDSTGLHGVTPALTKEGKTIECNFEQGK